MVQSTSDGLGKTSRDTSAGSAPALRSRAAGPRAYHGAATAGGGSDAPDPRDWLAAIIEGSDNAIISKGLDGVIRSWNDGATRLFGYAAEEAIGRPITILIPEDRLHEEQAILEQLHLGRRIQHLETQRLRKDGSLIDISLTVSPIRNRKGVIVGASKIARDITERRIAQEQQRLLMGEMQHRVKNLFALAGAIVSISAKSSSPAEVIDDILTRLSSLDRAHSLTMSGVSEDPAAERTVPFHTLTRTLLTAYDRGGSIVIEGDDCEVSGKAITHLSLLIYEFATNAAKYGALSTQGRVAVRTEIRDGVVRFNWRETGGPPPQAGGPPGFGNRLEAGMVTALGARIERDWPPEGLVLTVALPLSSLSG